MFDRLVYWNAFLLTFSFIHKELSYISALKTNKAALIRISRI